MRTLSLRRRVATSPSPRSRLVGDRGLRPRGSALLTAVALALTSNVLAAAPADAASTSEVDRNGRVVTVTGDDATNVILISEDERGDLVHNIPLGVLENQTDFDSDPGVQSVPADGTYRVVVHGGGGGDHITTDLRAFSSVPVTIHGDDGNDFLFGGGGADNILGGADHDQIAGGRSNDTIDGGTGNDVVTWSNGHGSDNVTGSSGTDAIEVYGSLVLDDAWTVSPTTTGLKVDRLNLGLTTLPLTAVEHVLVNGYGGDDTLTVEGAAGTKARITLAGHVDADTLGGGTAGETFVGGEDADSLSGGGGSDRLTGGGGEDLISGGAGSDVIDSRDGEVDEVGCGPGKDSVTADAKDRLKGCERVRR